MNILKLIGREKELFDQDFEKNEDFLSGTVESSRFLVIGGAGSIGQAVVKEIFKRNPLKLHVVDLSENNLVELVRDIRSSQGYIDGDFKTFALDAGSAEYQAYREANKNFDFVLNLSALKHVRSEKDPFTLMRLIRVNILNTINTVEEAISYDAQKYFCVSTDKAANPVNMMGASKRIMELFLFDLSKQINISTARFANVAFSDGSLLHSFNQRILKQQPIVAPNDVRRYFVTPRESGQLCLASCLLGDNNDIFFPKPNDQLSLITFSSIAENYLEARGYEPYHCSSEEEARETVKDLAGSGKWPCYFSSSDTTGEKDFEEFYTDNEQIDLDRFMSLGVVKNSHRASSADLNSFLNEINGLLDQKSWTKTEILDLFNSLIPSFQHLEKGKYLDSKM